MHRYKLKERINISIKSYVYYKIRMISEVRKKELISKLEDPNNIILEYLNKEYAFNWVLRYCISNENEIIVYIYLLFIDEYKKYATLENSEKINAKYREFINQLDSLKYKDLSIYVKFECYDKEADRLQFKIAQKAIIILEMQLQLDKIKIYSWNIRSCHGESLDVLIFFKKDYELNNYKENGLIDNIKSKYMSLLDEYGYFKKFNDIVRIEFDTDENVKRNYKGNYFYRTRE